jgi:hypothetical protein
MAPEGDAVMASHKPQDDLHALRARLRADSPPVPYDVERGLARHQALIEAGSPLPEWANELPPVRRFTWLRRVVWLTGALTIGVVTWSTRPPTASSPAEHPPAARSVEPAPSVASVSDRSGHTPTGTQRAPEVTPRTVVEGDAHHGRDEAPAPIVEPMIDEVARADGEPPAEPSTALERDERPATRATATAQPTRSPSPHVESAARRTRNPRRDELTTPQDAEEMRQLAEAESALAIEPVRALRLVRAGELTYRKGYFSQERRYIEVMALFALGRLGEAHAQADGFLRDYPEGPYRRKVELAMLQKPLH